MLIIECVYSCIVQYALDFEHHEHHVIDSIAGKQWPNIVVLHLLTYILYKGTNLCKYHHLGPLNNFTIISALSWFGNWTALIYPTRIHEQILQSSYRPW